MKTQMIAGILVGVLTLGSVADACHRNGARHSRGITGTISSVGKNTLSLSVPSSGGNSAMTVKIAANTRILGTSSHSLSALVGHSATVVGTTERGSIRASEIVISG